LHGGTAGREHGIDGEHAFAGERRELLIITAGDGGDVVALEADVADAYVGKEIYERLNHAETGAENRDDGEGLGEDLAGVGFERGLDDVVAGGEIAGRFDGEEQAELVAESSEGGGRGGAVAEVGEKVGAERVVEDVEHGARGVAENV
jgi:hypothetical protein